MMRVLFSSFFLTVCFGSAISSSDVYHARRSVRNADGRKAFGEGNYVSTVIFVDVPSFSNFTDVDDVEDSTDKFGGIHYSHIRFYKLSSAYALSYQIDLDTNTVQLSLNLGKAQIKGLYSASGPSSLTPSAQEFELNLYAHLIYSHQTDFALVEDGQIIFAKTDAHQLRHGKVKGEYSNAPDALANELKNYLSPKLLAAVVAKIYDEVRLKVSLDDVRAQLRSEIAYRRRTILAARFEKAIIDAFSVVPENALNVFYYDVTNFKHIFQNFEVTVPSYILRDVQKFHFENFQTSFVGVDVRGKARFKIPAALAVFKVVYRDLNKAEAENKTFYAEFEIFSGIYEFEMTAKPDSSTIEFGNLNIRIGHIQVSPSQGLYGDERDTIAQQLQGHLSPYFLENSYHSFSRFCKGLLVEGQITQEVFQ